MIRKRKERNFTGTTSQNVSEYEILHRQISKRAASEGMVLLKNENQILPLGEKSKIAVYGAGASRTIKGGTGSGDVNEREIVSIYQGLKDAGFIISNEEWIEGFEEVYQSARCAWRDEILAQINDNDPYHFFDVYCKHSFKIPIGPPVSKATAEIAIFVLSRIAGEGADRSCTQGDYCLAQEEDKLLNEICSLYKKVIVVINAGGVVDLSFMDRYENIDGLIQMVQSGMEAGNAFADILLGRTVPGGKLTDSWAYHYENYSNSATFSNHNGNTRQEKYEEGIYVGYRYFDSFQVPVRYGFGYGLSYTTFESCVNSVTLEDTVDGANVCVNVTVQNTGKKYTGSEVIQIYASAPTGKLEKEYRRLCAFGKTKKLAPGEKEMMKIVFPMNQLTSYDPDEPGWILESGYYGIWAGNSLNDSNLVEMLHFEDRIVVEKTTNICPLKEEIKELTLSNSIREKRYQIWVKKGEQNKIPCIEVSKDRMKVKISDSLESQKMIDEEAARIVEKMSEEELIQMACGDPGKGQGSNLGSAGKTVPGSAGETSNCAKGLGVTSIVLADGPAGLRLSRNYKVHQNEIQMLPFEANIEGGFLMKEDMVQEGVSYYQYCTSIPVGTLLAQSWDTDLLEEVGEMIGQEMIMFEITLWLAPGMNIHRNPLCGRNFEYYSEDPLLSGVMAAAITRGVQKNAGCGTTIKHFACNNQEDNRMGSDSIVSERALREIYLKGFEIAVKTSQPMAIMTSYNLINGVHAANNYDLCTQLTRNEWNFKGMIMTDWTTTENGPDCTAAGCMRAGNDLIMPGAISDLDNIRKELKEGSLHLDSVKQCIKHTVHIILNSNQYEDAGSYYEKCGIKAFMICEKENKKLAEDGIIL